MPDLDPDLDAEVKSMQKEISDRRARMKEGIDFNPDDEFGAQIDEGDQFMATKPWKGVVDNTVPTGYKVSKNDRATPDA